MNDAAGAIGAITLADLDPDWYPISLVIIALPSSWPGGMLHRAWHTHHDGTDDLR